MSFYSYMASMAAVLVVSVLVGAYVARRSSTSYAAAAATAGGAAVALVATLIFDKHWSADQQFLVWACAAVIGIAFWFKPLREALTGREEDNHAKYDE